MRWLRYLDPWLSVVLVIVAVTAFQTRWGDFIHPAERPVAPVTRFQRAEREIATLVESVGTQVRIQVAIRAVKNRVRQAFNIGRSK